MIMASTATTTTKAITTEATTTISAKKRYQLCKSFICFGAKNDNKVNSSEHTRHRKDLLVGVVRFIRSRSTRSSG